MVFIETAVLGVRIRQYADDDSFRALQQALIENPDSGDVIPDSGGLRKIRWPLPGQGKRGGLRVIYYWHVRSQRILFLFAFAKNEASDLTQKQRHQLRSIIESEYP